MKMQVMMAGVIGSALCAAWAPAAYVLTPTVAGGSSVSVQPGGSLVVDLSLSSDAADAHTSAVFDVVFSAPGLTYSGYTWQGTYAGGGFDNSQPANAALPALIQTNTYGNATSAIDLHFENFTFTPFASGAILSLNLQVPAGFAPGPITITAVPDTFSGDNGDVSATAGQSLLLSVAVPEPAIMGLLALTTSLALLRRPR